MPSTSARLLTSPSLAPNTAARNVPEIRLRPRVARPRTTSSWMRSSAAIGRRSRPRRRRTPTAPPPAARAPGRTPTRTGGPASRACGCGCRRAAAGRRRRPAGRASAARGGPRPPRARAGSRAPRRCAARRGRGRRRPRRARRPGTAATGGSGVAEGLCHGRPWWQPGHPDNSDIRASSSCRIIRCEQPWRSRRTPDDTRVERGRLPMYAETAVAPALSASLPRATGQRDRLTRGRRPRRAPRPAGPARQRARHQRGRARRPAGGPAGATSTTSASASRSPTAHRDEPVLRDAPPTGAGGRGVMFVDRLASALGHVRGAGRAARPSGSSCAPTTPRASPRSAPETSVLPGRRLVELRVVLRQVALDPVAVLVRARRHRRASPASPRRRRRPRAGRP